MLPSSTGWTTGRMWVTLRLLMAGIVGAPRRPAQSQKFRDCLSATMPLREWPRCFLGPGTTNA